MRKPSFLPRVSRLIRLTCPMLLIVSGWSGSFAQAAAPQCHPWNSGWYCEYTGQVTQAYINADNLILLYFDTPVDPSALASVGASASYYNAASYVMTANPDFGKSLYASLLTAQARGATVTVQMSSVAQGYLQMDRVWVSQ
jgi:hypothetical protein